MSDEQYERLFRLALGSKRYRHDADEDLIGRGYARVIPARHPRDRRTNITQAGVDRLRERLDFAAREALPNSARATA